MSYSFRVTEDIGVNFFQILGRGALMGLSFPLPFPPFSFPPLPSRLLPLPSL